MKRFRRWLFVGLCVLSLMLFVATVIGWSLCYCPLGADPRGVMVLWKFPRDGYNSFSLTHGDVDVQHWPDPRLSNSESTAARITSSWSQFGFGIWRSVILDRNGRAAYPRTYGNITEVEIFLLWPLLISLPLTVWVARRWVRNVFPKRNIRKGYCLSCGYDLRATPDRCPECGAVPPGDKVIAI